MSVGMGQKPTGPMGLNDSSGYLQSCFGNGCGSVVGCGSMVKGDSWYNAVW